MALQNPRKRLNLLRTRPPKMNRPGRITRPIQILTPRIIQIRRRTINHPRRTLPRHIMRQRSVGTGSRDVFIRQTHEIFGFAAEFGEAGGGFVFGDVVAFAEFCFEPGEESDLQPRLMSTT
jgi:hypothetical protein